MRSVIVLHCRLFRLTNRFKQIPYFNSPIFFFVQIDLKKMPLGKLSKKQITSAYGVLTELTKVSDMEKILVPWKAVCVILLHLKL